MKKIAVHTCRLMLIVSCTMSFLVCAIGIPPVYAQSPFNLSISGHFMPQADIEQDGARYAYQQLNVEASLLLLNLGYTFTAFGWEQADLLSLGDGQEKPW
jgi:hypothetical protein